MTREEAIEQIIIAARDWKEANAWAAQNSTKMLNSFITQEEAAEIMQHYFNKEQELFDAVRALDILDGREESDDFKNALEDL